MERHKVPYLQPGRNRKRMPETNQYSVQVVANAIDLLEALSHVDTPMSAQKLSCTLAISRNKTFRLLATLEGKGLVNHNKDTGTYQFSLQAFMLAQQFLKSTSRKNGISDSPAEYSGLR